ncbi:MAG: hypothetical protein DLM58_17260 [Pseudonocardiales bacterium]|nr:MAG: hypothetical protein DLM58_17260 [Pseudonocardiales bacterium]
MDGILDKSADKFFLFMFAYRDCSTTYVDTYWIPFCKLINFIVTCLAPINQTSQLFSGQENCPPRDLVS